MFVCSSSAERTIQRQIPAAKPFPTNRDGGTLRFFIKLKTLQKDGKFKFQNLNASFITSRGPMCGARHFPKRCTFDPKAYSYNSTSWLWRLSKNCYREREKGKKKKKKGELIFWPFEISEGFLFCVFPTSKSSFSAAAAAAALFVCCLLFLIVKEEERLGFWIGERERESSDDDDGELDRVGE